MQALFAVLMWFVASASGQLSQKTWENAREARLGMEAIVRSHAKKIQAKFDVIANDGEGAPSCNALDMCSPSSSAWSASNAFKDKQFTNEWNSCANIDLDKNGNILAQAITGRDVQGSGASMGCYPKSTTPTISSHSNADCKCTWKSQLTHTRGKCLAKEGKWASLNKQGCTDGATTGKCLVNDQEFGYIFPPTGSYTVKQERPANEICATNEILPDIKDQVRKHPQTGWVFLGMQETAMYRTWPALYQCRSEAQCSGCSDPRYRGWYASTASGPKDVVIVIDTSGSMSSSNRMYYAKEAALWVINTLSENDFAQVVAFSSTARSQSTTLLPMHAINKGYLKAFVNGLSPGGGTSFVNGFRKAFQILRGSENSGATSAACTQAIIFLTDGQGSDPRAEINAQNGGPYVGAKADMEQHMTRIFTYTFGADTGAAIMQAVACENGGIYHAVKDSEANKLKEVMANYFVYLAAGLAPKSQDDPPAVRWVDIYEDGQGRGQMTAACSPIYAYNNTAGIPLLFGVICQGIKMHLAKTFDGWDSEWASIRNDQKKCNDLNLNFAQLQTLRKGDYTKTPFTKVCPNMDVTSGKGRDRQIFKNAQPDQAQVCSSQHDMIVPKSSHGFAIRAQGMIVGCLAVASSLGQWVL